MILLVNVFITDKRNTPIKRFNLPHYPRYDVFRYTLASYASIGMWTKCLFYIKLDDSYQYRKEELAHYIETLFGKDKTVIHWHRHEYVHQWRHFFSQEYFPLLESLGETLTWFATDDDHVFIDYDTSYMEMVVRRLEQDETPFRSCHYSHWPEQLANVAAENDGSTECGGRVRTIIADWWDSIQIMSPQLLRAIFFHSCLKDDYYLPRCNLIAECRYCMPLGVKYYVATRELCRHFDGYANADSGGLHTVTPPLMIPPGFFENNIRINYRQSRREGWVNIDPLAEHHFAADRDGTDHKWMLEDLPHFWRPRITQVSHPETFCRAKLCEARNKAFMENLTTDKVNYRFCLPSPPTAWFTHDLRR